MLVCRKVFIATRGRHFIRILFLFWPICACIVPLSFGLCLGLDSVYTLFVCIHKDIYKRSVVARTQLNSDMFLKVYCIKYFKNPGLTPECFCLKS